MPQRSKLTRNLIKAILFEAALGVIAVLIALAFGARPPLEMIHWRVSGFVWGFAATLPMLLVLLLSLFDRGPLAELKRLVERMVRMLFPRASLWQLGLVALAAGWGEEMLFRGLIQPAAIERFGVPSGLVVASLVFGLFHPLSLAYFVLASLIGLYLGYVSWASGNLLVPILAHGLYDWVALALLLRQSPGEEAEGDDDAQQFGDIESESDRLFG